MQCFVKDPFVRHPVISVRICPLPESFIEVDKLMARRVVQLRRPPSYRRVRAPVPVRYVSRATDPAGGYRDTYLSERHVSSGRKRGVMLLGTRASRWVRAVQRATMLWGPQRAATLQKDVKAA